MEDIFIFYHIVKASILAFMKVLKERTNYLNYIKIIIIL